MNSSPISRPLFARPVPRESRDRNQDDNHAEVTSLRDRLKALSTNDDDGKGKGKKVKEQQQQKQQQQAPDSFKTPKKPKFLDVTAAFFSGPISHRNRSPPPKSAATPLRQFAQACVPTSHVRAGREWQPRPQQQRTQSPPRRFSIAESPAARELVEAVAAQSNYLFDQGVTKLGELDKSLRSIQADTINADDQLLNRFRESTRKWCKPLSDTLAEEEVKDSFGKTTKKRVHVGERIASAKDRLDTLDAEIASLWDQWENAQRQVNQVLTELVTGYGEQAPSKQGSVAAVRASLAREVASLNKELENILDDTHEEARAFEKDFSKRIQAVQTDILQGILI